MRRSWDADLSAGFARRLGKSAKELGVTNDQDNCPVIIPGVMLRSAKEDIPDD
jgi:hypothetical protein